MPDTVYVSGVNNQGEYLLERGLDESFAVKGSSYFKLVKGTWVVYDSKTGRFFAESFPNPYYPYPIIYPEFKYYRTKQGQTSIPSHVRDIFSRNNETDVSEFFLFDYSGVSLIVIIAKTKNDIENVVTMVKEEIDPSIEPHPPLMQDYHHYQGSNGLQGRLYSIRGGHWGDRLKDGHKINRTLFLAFNGLVLGLSDLAETTKPITLDQLVEAAKTR